VNFTKDMESKIYRAIDIDVGYHPSGFRIDKWTDPLNRYTKWTIDSDGNWINSKPVCFHSLPADGWIRVENKDRTEENNG
jgi:hypothetical protein